MDKYEYTLTYHLGNSRMMFSDRNDDGIITIGGPESEVLQESHYYPFGMTMDGNWVTQVGEKNRYLYNGKELEEDFGLELSDYGARWYDASIGRWGQVDPSSEGYYRWSSYCYGVNNSIRFIDPDGRDIVIHYQEEKRDKKGRIVRYKRGKRKGQAKMETKRIVYNPGDKYEGDNDFVKDSFAALDYMQQKEADGGIVKALAETGEVEVKIHQNKNINKEGAAEHELLTLFDVRTNKITFNNVHLTDFFDDSGENIIGTASPALGLLHELGHAYRKWQGLDMAYNLGPNAPAHELWPKIQEEEQAVVDVIERPAAILLGDGVRYKYSNKTVTNRKAKSVTSNKPK